MTANVSQALDGGLRVAPPVALSAASFMGLGLDEWMYIATIIYTVLQAAYLVSRWRRVHNRRVRRSKWQIEQQRRK